MSPNPKALIRDIHAILDSGEPGLEGVRVATEYRTHCQEIQERIDRFLELSQAGHIYAAIDIARAHPPLLIAIEQAQFLKEKDWAEFTSRRGLPTFYGFKSEHVDRIRLLSREGYNVQASGYRAFRKAMLLKDRNAAAQALQSIIATNPTDPNAPVELARIEKHDFNNLMEALEIALSSEDAVEVESLVSSIRERDWTIQIASPIWDRALKRLSPGIPKPSPIVERPSTVSLIPEPEPLPPVETTTPDAAPVSDPAKVELPPDPVLSKLVSRLTVIRRVGFWKDAESLVDEGKEILRNPPPSSANQTIITQLRELLDWYASESENERLSELRKQQVSAFSQRIDENSLRAQLEPLNAREIKHFRKQLERDWKGLQAAAPGESAWLSSTFESALKIIGTVFSERRARQGPSVSIRPMLIRLGQTWAATLVGLIIVALGLSIHEKQGDIARRADLFRTNLLENDTKEILGDYKSFIAKPVPGILKSFNSAANRRIQQARDWLDEIENRNHKIDQMISESESLLTSFSPDADETIRLNIETAGDFAARSSNDSAPAFRTRLDLLSDQLTRARLAFVEDMRQSVETDFKNARELLASGLKWNVTDPEELREPLTKAREHLAGLERIMIEKRAAQFLPDLDREYRSLRESIGEFENAAARYRLLGAELEMASTLDQYLSKIDALANLRFERLPLCVAARSVMAGRSKIQDPLRHMFMPEDEQGWDHIVANKEASLLPLTATPREHTAFLRISGYEPLFSIYSYKVQSFENGQPVSDPRRIFCLYQADVESLALPSSKRLLQTVQVYDSGSESDKPFSNEVFICTTDDSGIPLDGDYLELERLLPECAFFSQIRDLAMFDEPSGAFGKSLMEVMDLVVADAFIDPLFKAFLMQELYAFMSVRPYDWGLNLSPYVSVHQRRIRGIAGRIKPFDWLDESKRERLSVPLRALFEEISRASYFQQAMAMRALMVECLNQPIVYSGHLDRDGKWVPSSTDPIQNRLFGLDTMGDIQGILSIQVAKRQTEVLTPGKALSPLLRFQDNPEILLNRIAESTGLDLTKDPHRTLLPSLFLPSIRASVP